MNEFKHIPDSSHQSLSADSELLQRYGTRGPRYTSYPTAMQFTESFTTDQYKQRALASNSQSVPLSVYVHIPFCRSLCYYCGCNKIVTQNAGRVETYMKALHREITMQAALFDADRVVEQLHFGGGTPTYLSHAQLSALMAHLGRHFTLDKSYSREFSIEVDPRSVNSDSLRQLSDLGFNRLSLGVQDFDQRVQHAINRLQSEEEVSQLVVTARDCDFRSVSFDLIYGLPHQSVASFERTLDQVIDMRPDRVAVYNYAHLPTRFKGQRMICEDALPAAEEKLRILSASIEKLIGEGYVYIGMDHFALPSDELVIAKTRGTLQRNFQGYSTHRGSDLVALGVSAIGNIGNSYSQNFVTTKDYEARISKGELAVTKGLDVDSEDQLRADIIQDIMCHDGFAFATHEHRHSIVFSEHFEAELDRLKLLADDKLIELTDQHLRITPIGRMLLRNIAMVFDRYQVADAEEPRFSKAI